MVLINLQRTLNRMSSNTETHCSHRSGSSRKRSVRAEIFAGLFIALMPCMGARATGPSVEQFVHQLETSYKGVNSLKAHFTQTYQWGERSREESGTVYFAHGGRMRWEYASPAQKLFISDGKSVLMYVPDEKQLTRTPVKASEDVRVPFRLLLSRLDLGKVFQHIEFADGAIKAQPGDRVLRAIPKHGDDSGIHEVLLEITPDYDIRTLVLTYTDRGQMTFVFDSVKRNSATGVSLFEFTPPAGTEIINQK
jgi:outer membrane lipoprotein carrier protein